MRLDARPVPVSLGGGRPASRRAGAEAAAERAARMLAAGDRDGAVDALLEFLRDDAIGEAEVARLLRRSPAAPNAAAGAVRAVQSRKLEGALRFQLDAARLSDGLEEQCRFHPSRRWRFDFAWPLERLAVEVQGGVWIAGRHSGGRGQIADCEKLAAAVLEGWRVLYVTSPHIRSGVALNWIARARGRELEQAAGRRRATL